MIAQRSVLSLSITTRGVAQHASLGTPEKNEKESAIYKMSKVMDVLISDAKSLSLEENVLLGSNSQNIGTISGGTAGNVIPDRCEVSIDRRLLPSRPIDEELKRIKGLVEKIDKHIEITNIDTAPGFHTNEKSEFVQSIKTIMRTYYPKTQFAPFVAWSEAGLFEDLGDVVILGPGSLINQAHIANEYIESKDLFNFVRVYRAIMLTA
jgi:acetylornithine deacetylase/succinyl-diaminopimelate desuccinylase-like protein